MALMVKSLFDTPQTERMSARQYIDHPHSERKSDLIEGVFLMASPASFVHEDVQSLILTTMRIYVDSKRLGKVMGSNTAYRLSEENVFQPDVPSSKRSVCTWPHGLLPRPAGHCCGDCLAQQPPL